MAVNAAFDTSAARVNVPPPTYGDLVGSLSGTRTPTISANGALGSCWRPNAVSARLSEARPHGGVSRPLGIIFRYRAGRRPRPRKRRPHFDVRSSETGDGRCQKPFRVSWQLACGVSASALSTIRPEPGVPPTARLNTQCAAHGLSDARTVLEREWS